MYKNRHSTMIPIVILFFGVLLGVVLFKSELMKCEGDDENMRCCRERKDKIRHFGCSESSKDYDATKEEK